MIGIEINLRAVFGPGDVGIIIAPLVSCFGVTLSSPLRGALMTQMCCGVLRIQIAGAVCAIDRARDHPDVALVWLFFLCFS